MTKLSATPEAKDMELATTLSRFACSRRAASLRLGQTAARFRGLRSLPSLCSKLPCCPLLRAHLFDHAAVISLNRCASSPSSRPQSHTRVSREAQ